MIVVTLEMSNLLKIFLISILLLGSLPATTAAQMDEYTLKAIFLERFTRFIEWPELNNGPDSSKPFVIVVLGENPFEKRLDEIYSTKKIQNREVEITYVSNVDQIIDCDLLFISTSIKDRLPEVFLHTKGKPILTIGDTDGFAEEGVIINFYMSGSKIRFEINETVAREANLYMSYLLLKTAKIVHPIGDK